MHRRQFVGSIALAAACLAHPVFAADTYPSRPVTIVVPFSAGGGVDVIGRLVAEKLRVALNASILIENKPGASGMLGANTVVRAAPDGYTILFGSAGETSINPLVYTTKMQYSPERDLSPITLAVRVPNVLVANPSLPINNMQELVAYAKAHPGKLTYATSGVGNPQHLNGELLQSLARIKMVHVPYKGASGQLVDVASGNVDLTFVAMSGALPFLQNGKVKPIAITSAKRASFAPNIPAIAEYAPISTYSLENWFGFFVPAKTPAAIQATLNTAITKVLRDPDLAAKLREQGGEPAPMTQAQFKTFVKDQTAMFAKIVDAAHITAQD
jgi:tripartite-type tricarboxylate transporter receptor subunit TctC